MCKGTANHGSLGAALRKAELLVIDKQGVPVVHQVDVEVGDTCEEHGLEREVAASRPLPVKGGRTDPALARSIGCGRMKGSYAPVLMRLMLLSVRWRGNFWKKAPGAASFSITT